MTCHHVIWPPGHNEPDISAVTFSFDYFPSKIYRLVDAVSTRPLVRDMNADVFFAEFTPEFIQELSAIPISFFRIGEHSVNGFVVGHPGGQPLQISLGRVDPLQVTSRSLRHRVSTDGGSSGSPLVNRNTNGVFAMHHGCTSNHETNVSTALAPLIYKIFNGSFPDGFYTPFTGTYEHLGPGTPSPSFIN